MRSYYIEHGIPDDHHGCKGGIAGDGEYEVEIGSTCNFSFEMIALCTLHDEIIEILTTSENPLAVMVADRYAQEIRQMEADARAAEPITLRKESTSA
mgnify:CR=1 FL=1